MSKAMMVYDSWRKTRQNTSTLIVPLWKWDCDVAALVPYIDLRWCMLSYIRPSSAEELRMQSQSM